MEDNNNKNKVNFDNDIENVFDEFEDRRIIENLKKADQEIEKKNIKSLNKNFEFESIEDNNYEFKLKTCINLPKEIVEVGSYQQDIDVFCVRYEKQDGLLAAGYSNGNVAVFNMENNQLLKYMKSSDYPITSLRWKPYSGSKQKNIITSVTADGKIDFWHTSSGKILYSLQEKDNPIMCLDFNTEGTLFATAGNDKVVRLYDDNMKSLISTMKSNNFNLPGHSNRIFTVLFNKDNDNMLISGGWDNTLQIYDVREKNIVASVYGPHICGDSIDIKGNKILTGSWAVENQIQIFDMRTFKPETIINWSTLKTNEKKSTFVYSSQFAKYRNDSYMFSIGGSSDNIISTFNLEDKEYKIKMKSKCALKSIYSIDYSNKSREFAVGSGDGAIRIISYKEI